MKHDYSFLMYWHKDGIEANLFNPSGLTVDVLPPEAYCPAVLEMNSKAFVVLRLMRNFAHYYLERKGIKYGYCRIERCSYVSPRVQFDFCRRPE